MRPIFAMAGVPLAFALLALLSLAASFRRRSRHAGGVFGSRSPLTPREQAMYWRLAETFPQPSTVVLSQVSFDALLISKGVANKFSASQRRAEFVLVDQEFHVRAVIELDDHSHIGRAVSDEQRDKILKQAGYRVLRYRGVPDTSRLRNDIAIL
jgi:hypothetical protein